jgi:hypothetical protein
LDTGAKISPHQHAFTSFDFRPVAREHGLLFELLERGPRRASGEAAKHHQCQDFHDSPLAAILDEKPTLDYIDPSGITINTLDQSYLRVFPGVLPLAFWQQASGVEYCAEPVVVETKQRV